MRQVRELVDDLDRSILRQLATASLQPTDADVGRLVGAAPVLGEVETPADLLHSVGPLWSSLLNSNLQYLSRPAFALGVSIAVRLMEAHDPTIPTASLLTEGLQLEPSLGNALFRLGVVQYEQGRERRSTVSESTDCFRSCMRTFDRTLLHEDSLSQATRLRLLGMLGVAAAFLAREDAISLAELVVAHRRFEKSIELGNDDDSAFAYLAEMRIRLFQRTGNSSYLEGMRRRLRKRGPASSRLQIHRAEVLLHLAAAELNSGRLDPTLRWREMSSEILAEAAEALDPVTTESLDPSDTVLLFAIRRLVSEMTEMIDSGGTSSFDLDSGTLALPFGSGRSATDMRRALGDGPAARLLRGIAEDLAEASRASDGQALGEFALKYFRILQRQFPREAGADDVQASMELLADSIIDTSSSDRGRVVACDVLHAAWRRTRNPHLAARLVDFLIQRASDENTSVWPILRLADLSQQPSARRHVRGSGQVAVNVANGDVAALLAEAARRAHVDPHADRRVLGGRSEVYVAIQESGFVEDRFVFKTTDPTAAERERRRIGLLPTWVSVAGLSQTCMAPTVLDVVEESDGRVTLILQRAAGAGLDSITSVDRSVLRQVVSFLALLHAGLMAESDLGARNDFAAEMRRSIVRQPFMMGVDEADEIATMMKQAMEHLPAVPKRDAHPGNWIIGRNDSITAIDLSTRGGRPLFFELMQLLDDCGQLVVTPTALQDRVDWAESYLADLRSHAAALGAHLPDLPTKVGLGDVAPSVLSRAVFVLCLAERIDLPRTQRIRLAHHGALLLFAIESGGGTAMGTLAARLRARVATTSADRARLSRRMAAILRHDDAVGVDGRGWLPLEALDRAYIEKHGGGSDVERFAYVANHHSDTRFGLEGHRIRARYGHSIGVDLGYLPEEPPRTLFHGTSTEAAESIRRNGIEPMCRDFVHLVESPEMADRIGRRHGPPVVLIVDTKLASQQGIAFVRAVEGIWLVSSVPANAISADLWR